MGRHVNEASSEALELAHLYESAPIGLCVTDTQHRYVRINHLLSDINGVSMEGHIGRTIHEVIPDIADQVVSMFQNVIDSSEPVLAYEVRGRTSAYPGEDRIFLGDHYPLRSKAGTVLYVHTMVRDVTVERAAEAILRESNEALEVRVKDRTAELMSVSTQLAHAARVAAMGELAGSIAHEVRQPLSAILTNAQAALRFMKEDNPDVQEIHDILEDIVSDDKRAAQVITRLRSLLKKESVPRESVQLDELVDELLPLIRSEALAANIRIDREFAPNLPPVEADRIQIQQVIMNLMMNAIQAIRDSDSDGGVVRVAISSVRGDSIMVEISDDGGGVPEGAIGEVFTPFFTTKPDGLGIGLSLSKTIMEAHEGTIGVENLGPRGCCFSFVLPL